MLVVIFEVPKANLFSRAVAITTTTEGAIQWTAARAQREEEEMTSFVFYSHV
jgi:hypothetical protein